MVLTHVHPNDLVRFWIRSCEQLLDNYLILAEDTDNNAQIYLAESGKAVSLSVWINDKIVAERTIPVSTENFAQQISDAYEKMMHVYLPDGSDTSGGDESEEEGTKDGSEEDDSLPFSEEERDRIDEIEAAAEDFFTTLMENSMEDVGFEDEDMVELIYRIEGILYDEYGIMCWHPTMVDDFTVVSFPFYEESDDDSDQNEDDMAGSDNGALEQ